MRHVSLFGDIHFINGATYSYADSRRDRTTIYLDSHETFPGQSIRGKWRHLCAAMIVERLKEKGILLPLRDLYWLFLGGVKEAGENNVDALLDRPIFMAHPFGAFWGFSEPLFMERKVQIENANTESFTPVMLRGQRVDPIPKGEITLDMVSDQDEFYAWIDRMKTKNDPEPDADDQTGGTETADQTAAKGKRGAKRARKPGDPVHTNMPHSREMVPGKTTFTHGMDIRNPTPIQFGMFLATLRQFGETDPYFGARCGLNLGLADLRYGVRIDGVEVGEIKTHGRNRQVTMDEKLMRFERDFWQEFPNINFARPSVTTRAKKK
jgi:hypothetical protein